MSLTFELDAEWIKMYAEAGQPEWGPIGYVTYKRTYARPLDTLYPRHTTLAEQYGLVNTEEFWLTLVRVVEGTFSILGKHCRQLKLPWDSVRAQRDAQDMYRLMWEFKFLPPGRGLWMMGTPAVDKIGGAALNNCAFVSSENIDIDFAEPFCFLADMSMLGVGVGGDTRGAGKVKITKPVIVQGSFVVEDSREGWVSAIRHVLLSFVNRGTLLEAFDFSLVRPAGAPIKTFGGVASGPEPLRELLDSLVHLLDTRARSEDPAITSADIVDIFNMIGRCVVSGNVRRSAEIMFGEPTDEGFLELKDPTKNQKALDSHRWASNNSVFVEVGQSYAKLARQTAKNGEPGYFWLDNARKYSRMGRPADNIDEHAMGGNPCFSGDSLVAVADGRHAVTFKQLAEEGKDVPVYSLSPEGKAEIKWGRNPRMTRQNAELLRVHLDDGSHIDVTPDHKMLLNDGTSVEAKDLEIGASLPRFEKFTDKISENGKSRYWTVVTEPQNKIGSRTWEHRLVAKFFDPDGWNALYDEAKCSGWSKGGLVIHHKDFNSLNNAPHNLQIMTHADHASLHARDLTGDKNPMFGKVHSDETKRKIGDKTLIRVQDPEFRKRLSESHSQEERDAAAERLSIQQIARGERNRQAQIDAARESGLDPFLVNSMVMIKKNCVQCGDEFSTKWTQRHVVTCSTVCMNKTKEHIELRRVGQRESFDNRHKKAIHEQVMAFKDLKEKLGKVPAKKELMHELSKRGVMVRLRSWDNPEQINNWSSFVNFAENYNHRVLYLEKLTGTHDVFNVTVEDNYTLSVVTKIGDNYTTGIFLNNCLEQTLENKELCCLVETFPSLCRDKKSFRRALKFAYMYAKTVTLISTHDMGTNAVTLKNRRIGCSMSGIVQAMNKFGRRKFFQMCDESYDYIQELDKEYSGWLCVPRSIKKTSVKPSGTISLLPGVPPGIHYPIAEYYWRVIRFANDSYMVPILREAGYPCHVLDPAKEPNTTAVYFPVHELDFTRAEDEVSMWEQLENAAQMQEHWADNQVSVTIKFDRKKDGRQIESALELFETRLKGVSFLPSSDHGYEHAPYQKISKEQYEAASALLRPFDLSASRNEVQDRFCDGDKCVV